MRRILSLFAVMALAISSFAGSNSVIAPSSTKPAKLNAATLLIPVGKEGKTVSLLDLSRMKVKDVEILTGNKMNLAQKLAFKVSQSRLRNSIDQDGTINSKKLNKMAAKAKDASISKGLYIVLAIFGLAWIAMGVMDDWSGNNWWVNLILTLLFWLPGFIHAMIKMKDYYN